MSLTLILPLAALALLIQPPAVSSISGVPRMSIVTPDTAKAGATVVVEGEEIGEAYVKELYITDGNIDTKVKIVSQTESAIQFTIPATVKPGIYRLMVLTGGQTPKLIEEPVRLTIKE